MYGAAFLLLVFFAELPVEHGALSSVSVYGDGLLSFEQEYFYCVAVRLEVGFDVGSQQTTIVVRRDVEQDHLGFRNTVNQSSLSRANENRDYRIYEELGTYLISVVRPLYSKTAVPEITVDNVLYALDSTTISTSIKLATWALGKYSKEAVKMHTLLNLRGSIPANIHITHGNQRI